MAREPVADCHMAGPRGDRAVNVLARRHGWRTGLVLVSALAVAATVVVAGPATAGARTAVKVTLSAPRYLLQDQHVVLSGRASPAPTGAVVVLQRYLGGSWSQVARSRVDGDDRYRFELTLPVGTRTFRVVRPADSLRGRGESAAVRVTVLACRASAAPDHSVAAWFSKVEPTARTSSMTRRLMGLFCAAANHSTISIAMYYIRRDKRGADSYKILTALQRVHRFRGVHVRIILERRLYRRGSAMLPTLSYLRSFANVVLCSTGCRGVRTLGVEHDKFVTVSDTRWSSRVTPVTWTSSANWSEAQLQYHWQSSMVVYGDPAITKALRTRWDSMAACAQPGGCGTWNTKLVRRGLSPQRYGVQKVDDVWQDVWQEEFPGSSGRGLGMSFTPHGVGDAVADALDRYTCDPVNQPDHVTVRVAHSFISRGRSAVVQALKRLQDAGCHVSVLSQIPNKRTHINYVRSVLGVDAVRCLPLMHDKSIMVDALRVGDQTPERVVWSGSEGLAAFSLHLNDNQVLRLSVEEASPEYRDDNAAVYAAFGRQWDTEAQLSTLQCGASSDP